MPKQIISTVALSIIALAGITVQAEMTDSLRTLVLNQHNELRRLAKAADMAELEYDQNLECSARLAAELKLARGFEFDTDSANPNLYKACGAKEISQYVGENYLIGEVNEALYSWSLAVDEAGCSQRDKYISKTNYNGQQKQLAISPDHLQHTQENCKREWSNKTWRNYVQMIAAKTFRVGCWYEARVGTICHYYPGFSPRRDALNDLLTFGTPCRRCPSWARYCYQDLCTREEYESVNVCVKVHYYLPIR